MPVGAGVGGGVANKGSNQLITQKNEKLIGHCKNFLAGYVQKNSKKLIFKNNSRKNKA